MTPNCKNQETEQDNRPRNRRLAGSAIAPGLAEGKAFIYRDILSQGEAVPAESTPQVDVEHAAVARLDGQIYDALASHRVAALGDSLPITAGGAACRPRSSPLCDITSEVSAPGQRIDPPPAGNR